MSATFHTILPEWADYLLAAGLKKKLVTKLPIVGKGGPCAPIGAGPREGKIVF